MTTDTPAQIVQRLQAALRAGKIEDAVALFADSVDFSIPAAPGIPWIPPVTSPSGMRTFFELLGTHLEPKRFEVTTLVADETDAVAIGDLRSGVKRTGRDIVSAFALHVTVRDGRITRYHLYEDSYAVAQAYFDGDEPPAEGPA